MNSDQWYAVKRSPKSSVVYLMTGGDRNRVTIMAKSMFANPVIVKLTWGVMRDLIGCNIPGDTMSTDFCRGQIFIPSLKKYDLVIMAL